MSTYTKIAGGFCPGGILSVSLNCLLHQSFDQLVSYFLIMPPKELWEAYSNYTVCPSVRQSVRPASCPVHISYIL